MYTGWHLRGIHKAKSQTVGKVPFHISSYNTIIEEVDELNGRCFKLKPPLHILLILLLSGGLLSKKRKAASKVVTVVLKITGGR